MSRKSRRKKNIDYSLKARLRRSYKMDKEELENYYNITRKSAHVTKDKCKFDKKKSRREKIEY